MTDQEQKPVSEAEIRDGQAAKIGIARIDLKVPPRRIQEVLDEVAPEGTKTKLSEWEGQEVTVHAVNFFKGRWNDSAYVLFTDENGELFNMVVGGKIVLPKLAAASEMLPVICTFVKKEGGQFGRYWDVE